MITCESARIREFGRLINWGPLPSKPTPEAAPWALLKSPNPERGGGSLML
jgi:hypothetical protein